MGDDSKLKTPEIADSAARLGDSALGSGLGIGLMMLAFIGGGAGLIAASRWDGHLHPQQGCVQLQKIDGQLFKVNSCTGEVEEHRADSAAAQAAAATLR